MSVLLHFVNTLLAFAILAVGLNLVAGTGGLLNLGHAAMAGIGAYASVLLIMKVGLPWVIAFPAAGLLAALIGALIGVITLNLRGDYYAIATLGFGVVVESLLTNWQSLTRGPLGIPGIPPPVVFGLRLDSDLMQAGYMALILAATLWVTLRLTRSPWGRILRAVRDDEFAALSLGKRVVRLKIQAATLAAFFAGLAGAAQAHYVQYINPLQFGLDLMIYALVAIIFGGLGNHWGSVLGALLYVGLQQGIPYLGLPSNMVGPGQQAVFSIALILLLLYRPSGLLSEPHVASAGDAAEPGDGAAADGARGDALGG